MKTRITTGVIGAACLIALVIYASPYFIAAVAFAASILGLYEFYRVTGVFKNRPFCIAGYIGGALVMLNNLELLIPRACFSFVICIWLLVIFIIMLIQHQKTDTSQAALTVFSVFYIPNLFSYIPLVILMPEGRFIIWFVLIGAFATDTFAYFTGVFFGRHKLCPNISPKKTVEGAIGGTLGCGIFFLVAGYIFNSVFNTGFSLTFLFLTGIVAAIAAQLGDLTASVIKRNYGVKDYGTLFPGHGGIMDRCDSLIFTAPFIYFLFLLM